MTDDEKLKYLEIIQGVIGRLANNSFSLKGWAVTLVAAVFALAAKDADKGYFAIALIPTICFWGLDSFYLRQERLFRRLYDWVRLLQSEEILNPFTMDTSAFAEPRVGNKMIETIGLGDVKSWWKTCWSTTIAWFYAPLVFCTIILTAITYFINFSGG